MQIQYQRNLNQSYMIITSEPFYSGYQIHMCRQNAIRSLLPFDTAVSDGKLQFWYEITRKSSLDYILERKGFSLELLICIIEKMVITSREIRPYLLEESGIMLEPQCIYLEHGTERIFFTYCPGGQEKMTDSFRHLMEYILASVNHEDEPLVLAAYEVYQRVTEPDFSLDELLQILYRHRQGGAAPVLSSEKGKHGEEAGPEKSHAVSEETEEPTEISIEEKVHDCIASICKVPKRLLQKCGKKKTPCMYTPQDYQEQVMETPTEFLGEEVQAEGVIQYEREDGVCKMLLDHFPFVLGSGEQADGIFPIQGVSRIHARITKEDEIYYIEDLNSMNGTWLNEEMLVYHRREPLCTNDTIKLGREEMIFM